MTKLFEFFSEMQHAALEIGDHRMSNATTLSQFLLRAPAAAVQDQKRDLFLA
jgi:hypothetical protein